MTMADVPRGYLVMTVLEASGKNKEENYVWDGGNFEAYVKVELRGGSRNVKVATRKALVTGTTIQWNEPLTLEVLDNANELRVMLCKDKVMQTSNGVKKGTTVVAACGIYVNDILDAVPIDKYFELFKPSAGGEGGFIRLGLDFAKDAASLPKGVGLLNGQTGGAADTGGKKGKKKGGGWWKKALGLLLVAGAAAAGYHYSKKLNDERKKKE